MPGNGLSAIEHVVVLLLENRSFDHMLGFLYAGAGPSAGQPSHLRQWRTSAGQIP